MSGTASSALLSRLTRSRFAQREDGSLTIFSIFIFLMLIMVSGMAVDLMVYERERVGVQNTMDTAVVAASSLTQEADTDEKVRALVKNYFERAGYDPDIVTVNPKITKPTGQSQTTSRSVTAAVTYDMNTMFMNMVGIPELPGGVASGASEGQQLIEIALVLDISGSMGWNDKLQNMKNAAKEFVTSIIDKNGADRVMISIIPYNQHVYMDPSLMARLNLDDDLTVIENPPYDHANPVLGYTQANNESRCVRFRDVDFDTRRLTDAAEIEIAGSFSIWNNSYNKAGEWDYWCGDHYPKVMLYQNKKKTLTDHIDSLGASGWTSIDYGMKWAVGVLDPSFQAVVDGMVKDKEAPNTAAGHPVNFGTTDVFKYVVLMTDGANTSHLDLKDEFKSGPTRIWHSETLDDQPDTPNGYLVEMPDNDPSERWYIPGSPWTTDDDKYLAEAALPGDAVQWTYHKLYRKFSVPDAAQFFFQHSDAAAYVAHNDAYEDVGGYGTADARLKRICDKAHENKWIEVYTVAFEAPPEGETVLDYCASEPGNYFDVEGKDISKAFAAIAADISKLRLTN